MEGTAGAQDVCYHIGSRTAVAKALISSGRTVCASMQEPTTRPPICRILWTWGVLFCRYSADHPIDVRSPQYRAPQVKHNAINECLTIHSRLRAKGGVVRGVEYDGATKKNIVPCEANPLSRTSHVDVRTEAASLGTCSSLGRS